MNSKSSFLRRSGIGSVLTYVGLIADRTVGSVGGRDLIVGAGAMALVMATAQEAVNGPLAMPSPDPVLEQQDPVLVAVGSTPIRLSDARAQAVLSPISDARELPAHDLFETGLVDEAADQVALAQAAEQQGLDGALEVRAQLALARRRILSSALLDLAVARHVSEEQVKAAYDAQVAAAQADQTVMLRRIQVSSQEEAQNILKRIERGVSFAEMARRQSLDMTTRTEGGDLGRVRLSDLPLAVAGVVENLPIGEVSAPVQGAEGWYLLAVDGRTAVRLPPYAEMRDSLERRLRDQVVADTIAEARAAVPIRMAGNGLEAISPAQIMALQASAAGTW